MSEKLRKESWAAPPSTLTYRAARGTAPEISNVSPGWCNESGFLRLLPFKNLIRFIAKDGIGP